MKNIKGFAIIINQVHVLSVAGICSFTLLAAGCADRRSGTPDPGAGASGITLIAGLDSSAGWRPHLGQGVACLAAQAESMDPSSDRIYAYRVDDRTDEFSSEGALNDPDNFEAEVIHEVKDCPRHSGTFPAKFWKAAKDRVHQSAGPCVIEIFSDADNDDQSAGSRAELRRIGADLASEKEVTAVYFIGISRENRAYWEDVFGPLGSRLYFLSPEEMTDEGAIGALSAN